MKRCIIFDFAFTLVKYHFDYHSAFSKAYKIYLKSGIPQDVIEKYDTSRDETPDIISMMVGVYDWMTEHSPIDRANEVQRKLKEQFPPHFSTKNPIDLTGDAYDLGFGIALDEACLRYDGVDGVIICLLPQVPKLTIKVANIIADASFKSRKPIVACCMGGEFTANVSGEIEKRGVPIFPTPERAVDAMWALVKYGENLKKGNKR